MKYGVAIVAACMALAACQRHAPTGASVPPPTAESMRDPAHWNGFVNTRFGMDDQAFRHAWQGQLQGLAASGCYYLSPSVADNVGVAFMFQDGHFVRYDVSNDNIAAPGGGKVGMSTAQVRALYGAPLAPDPAGAGAQVLRMAGPQGGVLLFETDGRGVVSEWRVGVPPQIDDMERCG